MILEILMHIAKGDERKRRKQLELFSEQINKLPIEEIEGEEREVGRQLVYEAVKAELAKPDSASFGEEYLRRCSDGIARATGYVQFSGSGDNSSSGWYVVYFDTRAIPRVLGIVGEDPVTLKDIPAFDPEELGDEPPTRGFASISLFWKIFWPAVILIAAVMAILILY